MAGDNELTAIIGGTGFDRWQALGIDPEADGEQCRETPWGTPSGPLTFARLGNRRLVFLPRHGPQHDIPPHRINYRANIHALAQAGATRIVALAAVGGIGADCVPAALVLPDQLIDYTWGRESTFHDGLPPPHAGEPLVDSALEHVDFTAPFDPDLGRAISGAAADCGIGLVNGGVYGVTQGPRLETAAEIDRLERDGVDVVGMTAMPEAVLAREIGLPYAVLAMVVNPAAGRSDGPITMEIIHDHLKRASTDAARVVCAMLARD